MEYSEPTMSLRRAVKLEHLARSRITGDGISKRQPLRQLTGHYSVHRRAAEVIETARAKQEMLRKAEEQFQMTSTDDEIWHECRASLPSTTETDDTSVPCEDPTTKVDIDESTQSPRSTASTSSSSPAIKLRRPHLQRYQPIQNKIVVPQEHQSSPTSLGSQWMYDVLNLHFEQTAILESHRSNSSFSPTTSMSSTSSISAQIWRILSESLSRFYSRRTEIRQFRELEKLEAYGSCGSAALGGEDQRFWYPYGGRVGWIT